MGSTAQTRIVARVNGQRRRLLSISEKPDGKLIISGTMETMALDENGVPTHPIIEQKTTIHRSKNSEDGGNQVHHTWVFKAMPKIYTHNYTLAIKNGRVEPLYTQVIRNITHAERKLKIRENDIVKEICEYNPAKNILVLSVLVGPAGANKNFIQFSKKYNRMAILYSHFTVFVVWGFGIGASKDSLQNLFITAPPKIDGVAPDQKVRLKPANGLQPKEAKQFLESQLPAALLNAHRNMLQTKDAAFLTEEDREIVNALILAGTFKVCHDTDDKPLGKLRRELRAILKRHNRK